MSEVYRGKGAIVADEVARCAESLFARLKTNFCRLRVRS